jgi:hypothetical protein
MEPVSRRPVQICPFIKNEASLARPIKGTIGPFLFTRPPTGPSVEAAKSLKVCQIADYPYLMLLFSDLLDF